MCFIFVRYCSQWFTYFFHLIFITIWVDAVTIPILQMMKLRHCGAKDTTLSHTNSKTVWLQQLWLLTRRLKEKSLLVKEQPMWRPLLRKGRDLFQEWKIGRWECSKMTKEEDGARGTLWVDPGEHWRRSSGFVLYSKSNRRPMEDVRTENTGICAPFVKKHTGCCVNWL